MKLHEQRKRFLVNASGGKKMRQVEAERMPQLRIFCMFHGLPEDAADSLFRFRLTVYCSCSADSGFFQDVITQLLFGCILADIAVYQEIRHHGGRLLKPEPCLVQLEVSQEMRRIGEQMLHLFLSLSGFSGIFFHEVKEPGCV